MVSTEQFCEFKLSRIQNRTDSQITFFFFISTVFYRPCSATYGPWTKFGILKVYCKYNFIGTQWQSFIYTFCTFSNYNSRDESSWQRPMVQQRWKCLHFSRKSLPTCWGGKNTQNCTKRSFTTKIITMVWSLT